MISQISKWGNSQGVRISKKLLKNAGIGVDDEVEIIAVNNTLLIKNIEKKNIDWYLESYSNDPDRFDWGEVAEPKGREIL